MHPRLRGPGTADDRSDNDDDPLWDASGSASMQEAPSWEPFTLLGTPRTLKISDISEIRSNNFWHSLNCYPRT